MSTEAAPKNDLAEATRRFHDLTVMAAAARMMGGADKEADKQEIEKSFKKIIQTYVETEVRRELEKSAQEGNMPNAEHMTEMTERVERATSALIEASKGMLVRDAEARSALTEEIRSVLRDELASQAPGADAAEMHAVEEPRPARRRAVLLWAIGFLAVGALAFVAGVVAPEPTRSLVMGVIEQLQSQVAGTDTSPR